MTAHVEELLDRMLRLGLLEQDGPGVRLTALGRACGNSPLAFQSALRLIELIRTLQPTLMTARNLIAIVQSLEEADAAYTPMFKKGQKESVRAQEAGLRFGDPIVTLLQRNAGDILKYWARCKRASILWDWIHGEGTDVIEQRYTATPYQGKIGRGDIVRFADTTRWCLRSVHQIVALIYPSNSPNGEEIDAVCRSLEVGLPNDVLDLLTLPIRLTRGEYLALRSAGLRTSAQVRLAPRHQLTSLIGKHNTEILVPAPVEPIAIAAQGNEPTTA
jgi:replicative superfamily II helicase